MVLAEAMAASTPIVATDILGFRSVIRDGNQALLVPPRDEAALAEGIRQLIENPGLRTGMGMNGRAWVNQYAWQKVAGRVLDYYGEVIERARPGRGAMAAGG
jgi:phosphatidylinositol alpha-mannosyltransferase